ncbi:hypothetical protein F383_35617 [Gossypium arboreum]|uniref:Uncharacterized protein n=1 Tax=Gossypium arboreum TaxID=29729 RepID=A0A0B0N957_GOSAR|nr:hypothetical protein F383_35617 [Gossypium arboreum]
MSVIYFKPMPTRLHDDVILVSSYKLGDRQQSSSHYQPSLIDMGMVQPRGQFKVGWKISTKGLGVGVCRTSARQQAGSSSRSKKRHSLADELHGQKAAKLSGQQLRHTHAGAGADAASRCGPGKCRSWSCAGAGAGRGAQCRARWG